ncbi:MAG: superoxide dismutase family protein [Thermoanaerobaculia bacterium]
MKTLALVSMTLLILAGCASVTGPGDSAIAQLKPTTGSTAQGTVYFKQLPDGSVQVRAYISGVPAGDHGFHVHEKGDCGDNGNAAGGHFNPAGTAHGAMAAGTHAGDFGNVTATPGGGAQPMFTTRSITVTPGPNSVIGKAVILHANPDDFKTQPTGNAGSRIACGVVQPQQ